MATFLRLAVSRRKSVCKCVQKFEIVERLTKEGEIRSSITVLQFLRPLFRFVELIELTKQPDISFDPIGGINLCCLLGQLHGLVLLSVGVVVFDRGLDAVGDEHLVLGLPDSVSVSINRFICSTPCAQEISQIKIFLRIQSALLAKNEFERGIIKIILLGRKGPEIGQGIGIVIEEGRRAISDKRPEEGEARKYRPRDLCPRAAWRMSSIAAAGPRIFHAELPERAFLFWKRIGRPHRTRPRIRKLSGSKTIFTGTPLHNLGEVTGRIFRRQQGKSRARVGK
jgi:hypothetical protein